MAIPNTSPIPTLISDDPRKVKLAAIKAKTPRRAGIVTTSGQDFYLVGPTRNQWHQFKDAAIDPKKKRLAMENLAAVCCVDPTPDVVQTMFENAPALAEVLAMKAAELAGYDDLAELQDFGIV